MIEKAEQDLIQTDPGTEQNLDQNPSVETGVVEDDQAFSKLTLNNAVLADDEIKVLGVAWNRDTDTLKINFSVIVDHVSSKTPTKIEVSSATTKFYDPLGLFSPVILPLKCMFQKICQCKMNWDTPLPDNCLRGG